MERGRRASRPGRLFDAAAIVLSCVVAGGAAVYVYGGAGEATEVHVQGGGQEWVFPLASEEIVNVEGPLGTTVVVIEDHAAKVISSPCSEKTCIRTGRVSEVGDWIACLPNRAFVWIGGDDGAEVDAVTY